MSFVQTITITTTATASKSTFNSIIAIAIAMKLAAGYCYCLYAFLGNYKLRYCSTTESADHSSLPFS